MLERIVTYKQLNRMKKETHTHIKNTALDSDDKTTERYDSYMHTKTMWLNTRKFIFA